MFRCPIALLEYCICSVVRGATPRVGDRVMVEATFNQAMPFKWNALRVQLLPENAMQSVPQQQPPQQQVRQAPAPLPVPAVQQSSGGGGGGGSRWATGNQGVGGYYDMFRQSYR